MRIHSSVVVVLLSTLSLSAGVLAAPGFRGELAELADDPRDGLAELADGRSRDEFADLANDDAAPGFRGEDDVPDRDDRVPSVDRHSFAGVADGRDDGALQPRGEQSGYLEEKIKSVPASGNNLSAELFIAVKDSNVDEVRELLRSGADVHSVNKYRQTPLHLAHDSQIVQLLIDHGAPVNAQDQNGWQPIHFVRNVASLEILLKAGADPGALTDFDESVFETTIGFGEDGLWERLLKEKRSREVLEQRTTTGLTLLHTAVVFSAVDTEKVRMLIPLMRDLNVRDDNNRTPLDIAEQKRFFKVQEILRKAGAKTDQELRDPKRMTNRCRKWFCF
jgi:hypothetical protein